MKPSQAELNRRRVYHAAVVCAAAHDCFRSARVWQSGDPDLQPRVETTQRFLERMTAHGAVS